MDHGSDAAVVGSGNWRPPFGVAERCRDLRQCARSLNQAVGEKAGA
jgi:hypothetical protein